VSKPRIEPKILKGFRDYLPAIAMKRTAMLATVQQVFADFGFVPIDTPALEYSEILLGKGSEETDKQMFRFTDQGGRDVALRFDLTVPLARFVAMHIGEIGTPLRRYHIAPVWRAEKPQRGRYREFIQCDFDIIGTSSLLADAEILCLINRSLNSLQISNKIRINNRKILNGFLSGLGKGDVGASVLRAIDKLEKAGTEAVRNELKTQSGLDEKSVDTIFSFLGLSKSSLKNSDLIREMQGFFSGNELALAGVADLEQVLKLAQSAGLAESDCEIDLSIARGLDYYTGSVFETSMLELPEIGSICSGGRYDNLAELYSSRQLPGVGASIGLDRILGAYEALNLLPEKNSHALVFIALLDAGAEGEYLRLANELRAQGVPTETALETGKLGNQLKYAAKKGIPFALIAGREELASSKCNLKDLRSGEQKDALALNDVARLVQA